MSDKVYMASGNHRCRQSRYHTNPDCHRLDVATKPLAVQRESVEGLYDICKVCSGVERRGEYGGHYGALLDAAKGAGD